MSRKGIAYSEAVSVPLRGYGFEMIEMSSVAMAFYVSVPLRGYGFEILISNACERRMRKFPSPCGDMVLK